MVFGAGAGAQSNNPPAGTDYPAFRMIADQNIFDPNRFPHNVRERRNFSRSAPGFSLVGTMAYQKGMLAFFDGTDSDYRKVLAVDGTIAGYRVTAITLTGVRLVSSNKPVELVVGAQMRQQGGGWQLAAPGEGELSSYSRDTESASADQAAPDQPSAPPSSSEPNDVLKRLMQQREQESK